jgi:hypothetical protein
VPLNQTHHQIDILPIGQRLEIDHRTVTAIVKLLARIEHLREAAAHPGRKFRPVR